MKKRLSQKQIRDIKEQIYGYSCNIEIKSDELGEPYIEVHHTDDTGRIIYKEFWKLNADDTVRYVSRDNPKEPLSDEERWDVRHYRDMFYKANDECRYLQKQNEELQDQLQKLERRFKKVKEQAQPVKRHNERGAGRHKMDDKQQKLLEQFRMLKDSGLTRVEIQERMHISDATYYRYQKINNDSKYVQ